jgi:hypothetical protein
MKGSIIVNPSGKNTDVSAASSLTFSSLLMGLLVSMLIGKVRRVFCLLTVIKDSLPVVIMIAIAQGATAFRTYDNCKVIIEDVNYRFYWTVEAPYIYVGLQADSQGWIGMGISQDGLMNNGGNPPGSDIYMAFINNDYAPCVNGCIHDYYTMQYNLPILDAQQNINLVDIQCNKLVLHN